MTVAIGKQHAMSMSCLEGWVVGGREGVIALRMSIVVGDFSLLAFFRSWDQDR